ncbi:MAG: TrkA C-terminal domain-containing protein [Candidatus Thermoplasmatota archaeon]|nr:TrkA C-terminal domain-containing protein [Candidatus Thermoplasmatota archaeon]
MGLFNRRRLGRMEYENVGVKESLIEMKDLSEQIVDLSYSAILFDSADIARQVMELEERLDKLLYNVRIGVLLAARNREDAEQLSGILQVASAAEVMGDASLDLMRIFDEDVEFRPFAPFLLKDGDEKIWAIRVLPDSDIVNRMISEMGIESETGSRIIAIKRRSRWLYDIEPERRIREGDILIVRGVEDGLKELVAYSKGEVKWGNYKR